MKSPINASLTNRWLLILVSACIAGYLGCKQASSAAPASDASAQTDLSGFEETDIAGSTIKHVSTLYPNGQIKSDGYMDGDKKTGQWIEYDSTGDVVLINHFVNDLLEGPSFRMTFRNQVDLKTSYHLGELHGPWVQYKFGRVIEQRNYKNGKLDGSVSKYYDRTFSIQQVAEYKDGLQDGYYRYYDEDGNITLEYVYKKGEKVSGGMVEPKKK